MIFFKKILNRLNSLNGLTAQAAGTVQLDETLYVRYNNLKMYQFKKGLEQSKPFSCFYKLKFPYTIFSCVKHRTLICRLRYFCNFFLLWFLLHILRLPCFLLCSFKVFSDFILQGTLLLIPLFVNNNSFCGDLRD